jgi:glycosyltransferase involved in cell wall biosynthesis
VLIFCLILIVSLVGIQIFARKLQNALANAPAIPLSSVSLENSPTVAVIIPAYNEAANIEACVTAVLESTSLDADHLNVWVVDDQSSDETRALVELLQKSRHDPRLHFLSGQPRPVGEAWVGKNWACTQAVEQANGEFLLFIDADVRLKPRCIESAIAASEKENIGLLSLAPAIVCRHWSEWIAQPIIISLLGVGFDIAEVNHPNLETAFAAGPFMLFRRSAYEAIGGHRAVRDYIVEDVELAKRIKQNDLKLWYGFGIGFSEVQMYRSFSALWEGWTKNWFMGSNRNYRSTLYGLFVTFLLFVVPWLGLVVGTIRAFFSIDGWTLSTLGLSAIGVYFHYEFRRTSAKLTTIPPRYWWLTGVGGVLVCAIVLGSIIKTETGWGWTWRGRNLSREQGTKQA